MEMFAWVRGVREYTLEADKIALGQYRLRATDFKSLLTSTQGIQGLSDDLEQFR
jgi:hypothetical protein